jgi:hypothetical protein
MRLATHRAVGNIPSSSEFSLFVSSAMNCVVTPTGAAITVPKCCTDGQDVRIRDTVESICDRTHAFSPRSKRLNLIS